jgi:hypothetical protein
MEDCPSGTKTGLYRPWERTRFQGLTFEKFHIFSNQDARPIIEVMNYGVIVLRTDRICPVSDYFALLVLRKPNDQTVERYECFFDEVDAGGFISTLS